MKFRHFIRDNDFVEVDNPSLIIYVKTDAINSYSYTVVYPIEVEWVSGVLDFGNKLYEKTMFSLSFYVKTDEKKVIIFNMVIEL